MPNAKWREAAEGVCVRRFTHSCFCGGQKSTTNIFLFTLHLPFVKVVLTESGTCPFLLANEAQDLLVSQPRVLNLTHMLRQVFT